MRLEPVHAEPYQARRFAVESFDRKPDQDTIRTQGLSEKGLYMLATILKSKEHQKGLMQRSGEIITELLDDDLQTSDAETTIELNFAVLKFKHTEFLLKKGYVSGLQVVAN